MSDTSTILSNSQLFADVLYYAVSLPAHEYKQEIDLPDSPRDWDRKAWSAQFGFSHVGLPKDPGNWVYFWTFQIMLLFFGLRGKPQCKICNGHADRLGDALKSRQWAPKEQMQMTLQHLLMIQPSAQFAEIPSERALSKTGDVLEAVAGLLNPWNNERAKQFSIGFAAKLDMHPDALKCVCDTYQTFVKKVIEFMLLANKNSNPSLDKDCWDNIMVRFESLAGERIVLNNECQTCYLMLKTVSCQSCKRGTADHRVSKGSCEYDKIVQTDNGIAGASRNEHQLDADSSDHGTAAASGSEHQPNDDATDHVIADANENSYQLKDAVNVEVIVSKQVNLEMNDIVSILTECHLVAWNASTMQMWSKEACAIKAWYSWPITMHNMFQAWDDKYTEFVRCLNTIFMYEPQQWHEWQASAHLQQQMKSIWPIFVLKYNEQSPTLEMSQQLCRVAMNKVAPTSCLFTLELRCSGHTFGPLIRQTNTKRYSG